MSRLRINPIFGSTDVEVDPKLVFVLMPFSDEITEVYENIVLQCVEEKGLTCRRANDFSSNKAIMEDIWKAICSSRIVLADLTGFNVNVLYELGIAHTVGKETIMINQRNENIKFPFDLSHIRRIEYDNSAAGGKRLCPYTLIK
jgi:predicted nucleotide-binding protein